MTTDTRPTITDRLRPLFPWIAGGVILALVVTQIHGGTTLADGTMAPELIVSLSDGASLDLRDRLGKVTVVSFWAPWCGPCRAEAPTLTRIHQRISATGGAVIGICADGGALETIAPTARGLGMLFPVAAATTPILQRFRVNRLPTNYVIGRDGKIAWSSVGAADEEALEQAIARASR